MTAPPAARDLPRGGTRIAAIILAAGLASRSGPDHKLLRRNAQGSSMVGLTTGHALASDASVVILVLGHRAAEIESAAREAAQPNARLRSVVCPDFAYGLAASLACGIAAAGDADGALICLADMPLVTSSLMNRLIAACPPGEDAIIVPACHGVAGNPVLWTRAFFPALAALVGDRGGRSLMRAHASHCRMIELEDRAILEDFDTADSIF